MKEITILNRKFRESIPEVTINQRIGELAVRINNDLAGKEVIFLGILNGAFMFAADLFRKIDLNARISFVKLASYKGTKTSGVIKELIGWNEDIRGHNIVVVEDIIDTGETIERIIGELTLRKAADIKIAALLYKSGAYKKNISIDYVGFDIPDNFVIGYGLDFNGYGRNLPSIYTLEC
jgi:hypoxanthine phosphoribosyltransferase